MEKLKLLLGVILTGVGAALTYHFFENGVHSFINYVWYDTFNTDENRWIVIPLMVFFSFLFFGLQHWLDRSSEQAEEHGLGNMPHPTVGNYLKVLLIGFFSLVAGATLGPEAILVPACMILGGLMGSLLFTDNKQLTQALAAAGLMALFTAFFDSFYVGVASLLLVLSQSKTKFKPILLVIAIIAAGAAKITLNLVDGQAYTQMPAYSWHLNVTTLVFGITLIGGGFVAVRLVSLAHNAMMNVRLQIQKTSWVTNAAIASAVLAMLYLIGGPLVEFTGNKSIVPMLDQASSLGAAGLLGILLVKILTIAWSKAIGYRGGMIFPTIFLAAVMSAIVQLYVTDFNLIYGIIAVLIGAFIANKNTRILV